MNFFGHAAVACWRSSEPAFVLGAMLPDFVGMARTRLPATDHPELASGIAFHHATDDVFHDCPSFRGLASRAFESLRGLGMARGPARAVAHVGVEILLDGELARQPGAPSAYLAALRALSVLAPRLEWQGTGDALAVRGLVASLGARGVSPDHSAPEMLALRLARTLAHRPRLALSSGEEQTVRDWAGGARSEVARSLAELLTELADGLVNRGVLQAIPAVETGWVTSITGPSSRRPG